MSTYKKSLVIRFLALLLVIVLIIPTGTSATTIVSLQPRASAYIDGYGAYVYLPGGGKLRFTLILLALLTWTKSVLYLLSSMSP